MKAIASDPKFIKELEEAARLQLLQAAAQPLDEAQIEALRLAFGARW